jgi:hypothetical protein
MNIPGIITTKNQPKCFIGTSVIGSKGVGVLKCASPIPVNTSTRAANSHHKAGTRCWVLDNPLDTTTTPNPTKTSVRASQNKRGRYGRLAGCAARGRKLGQRLLPRASVTLLNGYCFVSLVLPTTARQGCGSEHQTRPASDECVATIAITAQVPVSTLQHAIPVFPTASEVWLGLLEKLAK